VGEYDALLPEGRAPRAWRTRGCFAARGLVELGPPEKPCIPSAGGSSSASRGPNLMISRPLRPRGTRPCYERCQVSITRFWFSRSFFFAEGLRCTEWGNGNELRRARNIQLAGARGASCRGGPVRALRFLVFGPTFFQPRVRRSSRLLAQPAIRVGALRSPPTMTFPLRQAGKRARPLSVTDSPVQRKLPKGRLGSRAVFPKFVPAPQS